MRKTGSYGAVKGRQSGEGDEKSKGAASSSRASSWSKG